MTARKTLRCDCGHDASAGDEWELVDAVRAHAWEAHGIDLPVELALALVSGPQLHSGGDAPHAAHLEKGQEHS